MANALCARRSVESSFGTRKRVPATNKPLSEEPEPHRGDRPGTARALNPPAWESRSLECTGTSMPISSRGSCRRRGVCDQSTERAPGQWLISPSSLNCPGGERGDVRSGFESQGFGPYGRGRASGSPNKEVTPWSRRSFMSRITGSRTSQRSGTLGLASGGV